MDYKRELTTVLIPKLIKNETEKLTFIFTDHSQRSEGTQCSETSYKRNIERIKALKDPC